jgi:predicted ATPase
MILVFVERLKVERDLADEEQWPFTIPSIAAPARHGLRLTRPVTFVVGENGSGKSTLVEAIAEAFGLDARGGRAGRKYAARREKTPLGEVLRLDLTNAGAKMVTGTRTKRKGYFLHALGQRGAQVNCAIHSPLLAALPEADVVEVGTFGMRHSAWEDLDIVNHWRRYLATPDAYLRRLIDLGRGRPRAERAERGGVQHGLSPCG